MNFRSLILTFALGALALPAFGAASDLIIPVTGTVAGADESQWQGELTIHNASSEAVAINATLHTNTGATITESIVLDARSTVSYQNAIEELFDLESGTGAIVLEIPQSAAGQIAITSRIMNLSPAGRFGQDVPAVQANRTLRSGSTAAIPGPAVVSDTRFNFGVFAIQESEVAWRLLSSTGDLIAEKTVGYDEGEHVQYNQGIATFFEATAADGMTVHARVLEGEVLAWGSIIAASTGDPTYVPGFEVRERFAVEFAGVDLDENGTVDVFDADNDGVLDAPITVFAGLFPNYFRVVVNPTSAGNPDLTLIEAPGEFALIDAQGTVQVAASASDRGTSYDLVVRASDGFSASDLVIPIIYR